MPIVLNAYLTCSKKKTSRSMYWSKFLPYLGYSQVHSVALLLLLSFYCSLYHCLELKHSPVLSYNQLPPSSAQDHAAKLQLCSKYLETFTRAKEKEKDFAELSIDLLVSMREIIMIDRAVRFFIDRFAPSNCILS